MTAEANPVQEQKSNDKELNFRALEAKYQRQLEQERAEKVEAQRIAQEALSRAQSHDDDDNSEPYVDHKKLDKKLAKFGEQSKQYTKTEIQENIHRALAEERQKNWIENNPDFYETLNSHAEKIAQKMPKLAESILRMPDGFERQQLVYNNIKALGLDKPEQKPSSIQEKIDNNRKAPYYQPSNVANAPYASAGDFSASGQKNAYEKMQELKNRMRLG